MSIKWIETKEELYSLDWEIPMETNVIREEAMKSNESYDKAFDNVIEAFEKYNEVSVVDEALEYFKDNFIDYYGE